MTLRPRRAIACLSLPLLLALGGCGYVHLGPIPAPVTTVIGDEKLMKENSDLRLEKKLLQQELALTRSQGEALRTAIENRAADGDTSKRLVEKLNEATRELTLLRTNYNKLQTERAQAVATAAEAEALKARLGATEEKLATSLRTYTELQGEVARLKSDVDRTRAENVALGEEVKKVTALNEQAQAALAQLNTDLLAQKDARFRAEQDAETLRTELKSVAPNASALARQRTGAAADARSLVAEHAAETAALKQQLADFRAQVDELSAERAQLKQKLGDATRPPPAELANVVAKLSNALRDATTLRDENENLKGQLAQLRSGSAGSAGVQSLREQLNEAQVQAAALGEENARLRQRVAGIAVPPGSLAAAPAPTPTAPPSTPATMVTPGSVTSGSLVLTQRTPPSGVSATLVTSVPGGARASAPRTEAGNTRFHTVAGGDTLAKISTRYYGTPSRWGDILAANRDILGETNNLVVGRTLRIP